MKKVVFAQNTSTYITDLVIPFAQVAVIEEGNFEALKKILPDAEAIVVGTWVKFTAELMDIAPKLRVISRTGVGVDTVDVAAATERGIMVLNTPNANSLSVAEHAVAMIGAMAKNFFYLHKQTVQGNFSARRQYKATDLNRKTLGLVGCGAIGRLVAAKCRAAYDMEILAYDPYIQGTPEGTTLVEDIETVFSNSDFVSVHLPLTKETRHIVNAKLIRTMKSSAYLINTARGGLVDEEALYNALKNGDLAGAALDVFEQEPPPADWKLATLDNILLTPHSAALTKECVERVAVYAAKGVIEWLGGETPQFVYNKAVLENGR